MYDTTAKVITSQNKCVANDTMFASSVREACCHSLHLYTPGISGALSCSNTLCARGLANDNALRLTSSCHLWSGNCVQQKCIHCYVARWSNRPAVDVSSLSPISLQISCGVT